MVSDTDALNYPRIHIRDVEWLKRTLLVFPHVVRILPENFSPLDDPRVRAFCEMEGRRGPLLRSADISSEYVQSAQSTLIRTIQSDLDEDLDGFRRRFGRLAAERLKTFREAGFHIHRDKMTYDMNEFLITQQLAWQPDDPDLLGFLELHPRLGEGILASLAFACAENEGLKLVTEFPETYSRTLSQPKDRVYRACLAEEPTAQPDPSELAVQFLVYHRCNTEKLTPERLKSLNKEWEAFAAFRESLEVAASRMPKGIRSRAVQEQYLNDVVDHIFRKWEGDKANMSNYVRQIFKDVTISRPGKLLEKLAEKAFTPAVAGSAATVMGSLTKGALTGATIGFVVGLMVYGAEAWQGMRGKQRSSPYRYLSMLEKSGVAFVIGR